MTVNTIMNIIRLRYGFHIAERSYMLTKFLTQLAYARAMSIAQWWV